MSDQPPTDPYRPGHQPSGGGQPPQHPYGGQPPQQSQHPYGGQPPQQSGGGAPVGSPAAAQDGPRRSRTGLIIALVLAIVVVLAGGATFAYAKVTGGGQQPAEALPGNADAYWRMDIDPSVGQKVAAVRFLSKFPTSHGDFTTGDVREKLWDAVKKDSPQLSDIDYATDIKPWLGDRVGVSVSLPERKGAAPIVAMALEVKDQDRARAGIDKMLEATGDTRPGAGTSAPTPGDAPAAGAEPAAYFFHGDYAVFTQPGQVDTVKDAIEAGPLAEDETFKSDMADLGEQGIMSAWGDLGGMADAFTMLDPGAGSAATVEQLKNAGRVAIALRFDSDYLELAGITRGQQAIKKPSGDVDSAISTLPEDTAVAMSLSNGDQLIDNAWQTLMDAADDQAQQRGSSTSPKQAIEDLKSEYGIALPDDLKTLVGSNFVIAAPDQDIEQASGPQDVTIGARVKTDPDKAADVMAKLEKLARDSGQELPIVHRADGDQFLASVNDAGVDWIAQHGTLGDTDAFRLAVPDAKTAQYSLYVDLDKIEHHYLDRVSDPEMREFVQALRSFGMTAHVTGDGEGEFSVRLVGN